MDLRIRILVIIVCIQYASGLFIPSGKRDFRKKPTATVTSKYSDLLSDLAVIKLKLETMGYGPVYIEGPYGNTPMGKSLQDKELTAEPIAAASEDNGDAASQFNEMEVLELVPVIIEQKRKGNVSPDEENTLKEIFGDLWTVIEEEVNRDEAEEDMNPILKALLQSRENRLKRALVQPSSSRQRNDFDADRGTGLEVHENNDIFGNTVDRVRVTRWPKSFLEAKAELSPQQRLMRHAAFLIRQWFDENSPKVRGGLKRGRLAQQQQKARNKKKRGSQRRHANRRKNQNRRRRRNNRVKKNLRPKRHNTDIYVDDNHAGYDYIEDFEELLDDPMTKPRSMRSSTRPIFNEYDSIEDEQDYDDYE